MRADVYSTQVAFATQENSWIYRNISTLISATKDNNYHLWTKASFFLLLECDKCGKTWIDSTKFQKHLQTAHMGEPKTQRRIATSETPDALPSMNPMDTSEIFFECAQCKKNFNVHQEYINHLRRDHGPYRVSFHNIGMHIKCR